MLKRAATLAIALATAAGPMTAGGAEQIDVGVDTRVELFSVLERLANYPALRDDMQRLDHEHDARADAHRLGVE